MEWVTKKPITLEAALDVAAGLVIPNHSPEIFVYEAICGGYIFRTTSGPAALGRPKAWVSAVSSCVFGD